MSRIKQTLLNVAQIHNSEFGQVKEELALLDDSELQRIFINATVIVAEAQSVRGKRKRSGKDRKAKEKNIVVFTEDLEENSHGQGETKSLPYAEEGGSCYNNRED